MPSTSDTTRRPWNLGRFIGPKGAVQAQAHLGDPHLPAALCRRYGRTIATCVRARAKMNEA